MSESRARGVFVGRSTLDLVYACARFPEPDGKVDAERSYRAGGGPALNAAVAFAGLGGTARLLSVVGEGPFAEAARRDVGGHGVELFDAAAGEADVLPVSTVILTGAARAIVNQPLPERSGGPPPGMPDRLFDARPDMVLSDGHLPELAVPVLKRAREAGVATVLDGGSWKPWTGALLPLVDIAVVSSRFRPPGASDVLAWLGERIGAVAVTNGAHPIRWRQGEASGEIVPPRVEAVDTLGAGDIFHGAFCCALASGKDFAASLASAADVAAASCERFGPRAWIAERT
jgi:sugar/nucleoside kinase (ribokinase family)